MDLALKDIRRHLGKFVATIVGVAMLLSIVLEMNGIYQGNIRDGVWLIDAMGADLWLCAPTTLLRGFDAWAGRWSTTSLRPPRPF